MLLFAWFYLSSGSPVSAKHSKNGKCSCSHCLLPFISKSRLCKELFVFLPLLPSGVNLALRRIANEHTGDRDKVFFSFFSPLFAWFVVHLEFLSRKEFLRTRHVRIFLFGHLPFSKRVGRSKANEHCRGVLQHSLTGRYRTPSENEASVLCLLRFYFIVAFLVGTFSQTGRLLK